MAADHAGRLGRHIFFIKYAQNWPGILEHTSKTFLPRDAL